MGSAHHSKFASLPLALAGCVDGLGPHVEVGDDGGMITARSPACLIGIGHRFDLNMVADPDRVEPPIGSWVELASAGPVREGQRSTWTLGPRPLQLFRLGVQSTSQRILESMKLGRPHQEVVARGALELAVPGVPMGPEKGAVRWSQSFVATSVLRSSRVKQQGDSSVVLGMFVHDQLAELLLSGLATR
jgi:hypothetical protein